MGLDVKDRQRTSVSLPRALGTALRGISMILFFFLGIEMSDAVLPQGCPSLPERGQSDSVSISVTKTLDATGFVCIRVINGLKMQIATGGPVVRLQEKKRRWWGKSQFDDFKETPPGGIIVGSTLVPVYIPAGQMYDQRLPYFSPAPPGTYRACFRYEVFAEERKETHEVCSEEFSLP